MKFLIFGFLVATALASTQNNDQERAIEFLTRYLESRTNNGNRFPDQNPSASIARPSIVRKSKVHLVSECPNGMIRNIYGQCDRYIVHHTKNQDQSSGASNINPMVVRKSKQHEGFECPNGMIRNAYGQCNRYIVNHTNKGNFVRDQSSGASNANPMVVRKSKQYEGLECPNGMIRNIEGQCDEPIVARKVFLYSAPGNTRKQRMIVTTPKPDYKFVLVNNPEDVKDQALFIRPKNQNPITNIYGLDKIFAAPGSSNKNVLAQGFSNQNALAQGFNNQKALLQRLNNQDTLTQGLSNQIALLQGLNQNTLTKGLNNQNTVTQGLNNQNTLKQGLNHQNTLSQGLNNQIALLQGLNQNTLRQGLNNQNALSQGLNNQIALLQGLNQNTLTQGLNDQNTVSQGLNNQNTLSQGLQNALLRGLNNQNTPSQGLKNQNILTQETPKQKAPAQSFIGNSNSFPTNLNQLRNPNIINLLNQRRQLQNLKIKNDLQNLLRQSKTPIISDPQTHGINSLVLLNQNLAGPIPSFFQNANGLLKQRKPNDQKFIPAKTGTINQRINHYQALRPQQVVSGQGTGISSPRFSGLTNIEQVIKRLEATAAAKNSRTQNRNRAKDEQKEELQLQEEKSDKTAAGVAEQLVSGYAGETRFVTTTEPSSTTRAEEEVQEVDPLSFYQEEEGVAEEKEDQQGREKVQEKGRDEKEKERVQVREKVQEKEKVQDKSQQQKRKEDHEQRRKQEQEQRREKEQEQRREKEQELKREREQEEKREQERQEKREQVEDLEKDQETRSGGVQENPELSTITEETLSEKFQKSRSISDSGKPARGSKDSFIKINFSSIKDFPLVHVNFDPKTPSTEK